MEFMVKNAVADVVHRKTQSEFPALYIGGTVCPVDSQVPRSSLQTSRTGILANVLRILYGFN